MLSRPLLLGHRGARAVKSIPENTLASFDRALVDGCDGFEFDLRLTSDGEAVVCHDAKVGRLHVARTQAAQLPGLIRLPEVLDRYRKAFLDIELKVPGMERIVSEALKGRDALSFVVSSFLPEVLANLRSIDGGLPLGLICETNRQLSSWKESLVDCVIPQRKLVQKELIDELHANGKKVLVWTVNVAAQMKQFAEWGVDGIISDNPKRLSAAMAG